MNHQRIRAPKRKDGKMLETLEEYEQVKLDPKFHEKLPPSKVIDGGKGTVTHSYETVTFKRAVFEIDFDFGADIPSKANDWHLRNNPCWPKHIAPKDPGFVLLPDDPFYNLDEPVDWYKGPPSREEFDVAQAARKKQWPNAKEISDEGVPPAKDDAGKPPAPKQQKPNPPAGGKRRRLALIDDRIHLRDDDFNVTRPLTEDELRNNVEVIQCTDRRCAHDQANDDGEDGSLYVPGTGPPSTPSAVNAVPTLVTSVVQPEHFKRSSVSADVPLVTAILHEVES